MPLVSVPVHLLCEGVCFCLSLSTSPTPFIPFDHRLFPGWVRILGRRVTGATRGRRRNLGPSGSPGHRGERPGWLYPLKMILITCSVAESRAQASAENMEKSVRLTKDRPVLTKLMKQAGLLVRSDPDASLLIHNERYTFLGIDTSLPSVIRGAPSLPSGYPGATRGRGLWLSTSHPGRAVGERSTVVLPTKESISGTGSGQSIAVGAVITCGIVESFIAFISNIKARKTQNGVLSCTQVISLR